jgi:NAD(P)-dependent dehydrogenase (short-subunit alcohol dehydrogenase family)
MVKQQKGRIDILFANAGLWEFAPLEGITESHFDKIFSINVKGLLFTVQKALPLFRDGGPIILTISGSASKGFEALSVYSATKAAIRLFARSWTFDLKRRKIRVNAINPGPIDTLPFRLSISEQLETNHASPIVNVSLSLRLFDDPLSPSISCATIRTLNRFLKDFKSTLICCHHSLDFLY